MLIWRQLVAIGITIMFCTFPVVLHSVENPRFFRWVMRTFALALGIMGIGFVGEIWT
jgi:hypothetical protein